MFFACLQSCKGWTPQILTFADPGSLANISEPAHVMSTPCLNLFDCITCPTSMLMLPKFIFPLQMNEEKAPEVLKTLLYNQLLEVGGPLG